MPAWEKMHLRTAASVQPVTFISLNYFPSDTVAHSCCKVALTFSNHLATAGRSLWIDLRCSFWNSVCVGLHLLSAGTAVQQRLLKWHLCKKRNNSEFKLHLFNLSSDHLTLDIFSLHHDISMRANESFASFSLTFKVNYNRSRLFSGECCKSTKEDCIKCTTI